MNLFQVTKKQEGGDLELKTFTGNPVTFTPSYSEELPAPFNGIGLKANITASQDLHGYDHPWPGGAGKNKFGGAFGELTPCFIPANTEVCASTEFIENYANVFYYDENQNLIDYWAVSMPYDNNTRKYRNFTITQDAYYFKFDTVQVSKMQVEKGSQASPYEPYENICPTIGHSELNLVRCGVNLFDKTATDTNNGYYPNAWLNSANGIVPDTDANISEYIRVPNNTNLFIKGTTFGNLSVCFYDESKTFISGINYNYRTEFAFTTPDNTAFLRFSIIKANIDITQLELGSTATPYAPYNGDTFTVSFGQTVYGGVYDANADKVTDNVKKFTYTDIINNFSSYDATLNRYRADMKTTNNSIDGGDGSVVNPSNAKCNIADCSLTWNQMAQNVAYPNKVGVYKNDAWDYTRVYIYIDDNSVTTREQAETWLTSHNFELVYELATPIEIDVSELSVDTIVGVNNIVSDCGGDITVTCLI